MRKIFTRAFEFKNKNDKFEVSLTYEMFHSTEKLVK